MRILSPKTDSSPLKIGHPTKESSSNHWWSGASRQFPGGHMLQNNLYRYTQHRIENKNTKLSWWSLTETTWWLKSVTKNLLTKKHLHIPKRSQCIARYLTWYYGKTPAFQWFPMISPSVALNHPASTNICSAMWNHSAPKSNLICPLNKGISKGKCPSNVQPLIFRGHINLQIGGG